MFKGKGKKKEKVEVPEQVDESIDMPDENEEVEDLEKATEVLELKKRIKELELKEKGITAEEEPDEPDQEVPDIKPTKKEVTEAPAPVYRPVFNPSDIKDSAILRAIYERINYLTNIVETEIAK